jgi:hypothetical protein
MREEAMMRKSSSRVPRQPNNFHPNTRPNMSTHELPLHSAKSTSRRLGKVAVLSAALAVGMVPVAQAVVLDTFALNNAGTLLLDATTGLSTPEVVTASHNGVILRANSDPAQLANVNQVRALVNTGFNGALWDGTGITSRTAGADALLNGVLGVMMYDNDQLGYTSFLGKDLTTNPHQVLLRMTYAGDYDSNGFVTTDDYGFLDFYFGQGLNAQGDIDGDGLATPGDYGVLDFTFAQAPGTYGPLGNAVPSGGAAAGVPVPEPTSASLLLLGVAAALHRRNRK